MGLSVNTGFANMPKIVWGEERQDIAFPALDGSVHWIGGLVSMATGSTAAPSGAEFGIDTYADDGFIYGFVTGFLTRDGNPIQNADVTGYAGTLVNATGYLPAKYTFSASNDESNATPAGEMVLVRPIFDEDIIEISLWGASTSPANRGTTIAAGTTGSSNNFGVSMSVNPTYPFSLLESTSAVAMANLDFVTTRFNGKQPVSSQRVFANCIRAYSKLIAPN